METDTENEKVLTPFLRSLVERGLDVSQGLLVILDGAKGLRAAVRTAFRGRALVQRCQWHTRENVVSYLATRRGRWRGGSASSGRTPGRTTTRPSGHSRRSRVSLEERNQSAAGSLAEGLEETVTRHRLGLIGVLGRSLKTTNGLESVNALVEERCATVDHWQKLESTPTLAGDRAPGYRTPVAEGGGLPPSAQAPRRAKTRAED